MVSIALYSAIIVVGISTIIVVGTPILENMQDSQAVDAAKDMLTGLEEQIRDVATAGEGSRTAVGLRFARGEFIFDAEKDQVAYELDTDTEIIGPHTSTQIGNLRLSSLAGVSISESSVNGEPCWKMENEHISVCIRQVSRNVSDHIESDTVGYWRFNHNSGGTAYDNSSQGNEGTINGATWVDGKQGSALQFDGVNDYVSATVSDDKTSVALWANNDGTWNHYVNADGTWYENGESASVSNDWYRISGNTVDIARNGTSSPSDYFNGTIDEVRIWDRALSAEEVGWLYKQGGTLDYIDTEDLILRYYNKNVDEELDAEFSVNLHTDQPFGLTHNGTGYVQPELTGSDMGRGRIRATVHSSFGIDYTVVFSLISDADFLQVDVEE